MKEKLTTFFLSKINIARLASLIKKSKILSVPYKYMSQRLIDYNFPRHLFIETTNACNLQCKICTRNLKPLKIGVMDFSLFKKIIDEAKNYGPRTFSLHLFGEPLLSPKIKEIIEYIKQKNKKNTILLTTNGVFLKKEIAQNIVTNNVDKIVISIHGADEKTYKEITGKDELKKVERNIETLIEIKNKHRSQKPKIYLRMVVEKKYQKEINEFQKKWQKKPIIIDVRPPHNFGGRIQTEKKNNLNFKRYPCYHLWFSPGVNWDGDVSICCCDTFKEKILGNAKNQTVSEIWKNNKIKKYRQYHLNGQYEKISLCQNCDVWKTYPDMFFKWQKK